MIRTDAVTSVQPLPKQHDLQFWHSRRAVPALWSAFLLLSFMADVRPHDISWRINADVRHSWLLFWGRTEESKIQRNLYPPFYILSNINPTNIFVSLALLLGLFAKLRKATIRFFISVRVSVHVEQLSSHATDFHKIWYLRIFRKLSGKFSFHKNLTIITGFTWRPIYIF